MAEYINKNESVDESYLQNWYIDSVIFQTAVQNYAKENKMENKIMAILEACYREFCDIVGDSPCGCDACPYKDYITEDNEEGCYEAYINDKLEGEENNA